MFSIEEIRRNADARIDRYHREARHASYSRPKVRSIRRHVADRIRSIAAWIEPTAPYPRGVSHAPK